MVQAWPIPELHLGLHLVDPRSYQDSLWTVLHSLDALPARGVQTRKSRLRVVDFRRDPDLIEPNYSFEDAVDSPFLYSAWMEPEVPKTKVRQRRSLRKKPSQDWQPLDLYINISLDTWYRNTLVSCILRKVQHSCRPLRLFCGKLHIRNVVFSQTVEILDLVQLEFIQELDVSDCFGLFSGESQFARQVEQMKNLRNLTLPQPIFETTAVHRLLPSDAFNSFLSRLSSLGRLQMLRLSSPHLSDHLHRLLRYLSDALVTLELPACALLIRDICWLSQSPQASHLKKLDLSKNDLSQMVPGVLEALLREASGFLQELVLDYCSLRDPHLVGLLPALRCCFLLYSLSLSGNRIATSILENLLQLVAELSELKLVVCPYPVECYDYPKSRELGQIQERRSSSVEAMVQDMLWALGQESLEWTFTSETSF
uniref:Leucine-rich repeat-containing protein 14 n=1 Tax=Camelus bactrianus TaxID=9837 RepID=A0A9W3GYL2_CAMBA|nr:leucine-rich repeat-containing protein 14-like [Camelus bactrianus]